MFRVTKSAIALVQEFAALKILELSDEFPFTSPHRKELDPHLRSFQLVMQNIWWADEEHKTEEPCTVCYTITSEKNAMRWQGYQSDKVLRRRKNPLPDFPYHWEVVVIRSTESGYYWFAYIFIEFRGKKYNATDVFLELTNPKYKICRDISISTLFFSKS